MEKIKINPDVLFNVGNIFFKINKGQKIQEFPNPYIQNEIFGQSRWPKKIRKKNALYQRLCKYYLLLLKVQTTNL
jgi:hypothetical protein